MVVGHTVLEEAVDRTVLVLVVDRIDPEEVVDHIDPVLVLAADRTVLVQVVDHIAPVQAVVHIAPAQAVVRTGPVLVRVVVRTGSEVAGRKLPEEVVRVGEVLQEERRMEIQTEVGIRIDLGLAHQVDRVGNRNIPQRLLKRHVDLVEVVVRRFVEIDRIVLEEVESHSRLVRQLVARIHLLHRV